MRHHDGRSKQRAPGLGCRVARYPISSSRAPTPISVCCSSTAPGRSRGCRLRLLQPARDTGRCRPDQRKVRHRNRNGESGTIHLAAVPAAVARVLVVATMDTEAGHGFGALTDHGAGIVSFGIRWTFRPVLEPVIRAAILFEIYRHTPGGGREQWKVRAIGQGWSDGLAGLARDHGVDVDD